MRSILLHKNLDLSCMFSWISSPYRNEDMNLAQILLTFLQFATLRGSRYLEVCVCVCVKEYEITGAI